MVQTQNMLGWECLGIPPEELEDVASERDIWTTFLGMLLT